MLNADTRIFASIQAARHVDCGSTVCLETNSSTLQASSEAAKANAQFSLSAFNYSLFIRAGNNKNKF